MQAALKKATENVAKLVAKEAAVQAIADKAAADAAEFKAEQDAAALCIADPNTCPEPPTPNARCQAESCF